MASSDSIELGQKILQLHQDFVAAFKERFGCKNKNDASVNSSKIWQKLRKEFKDFHKLKCEVHKQIENWKRETQSASIKKGTLQSLWKSSTKKSMYGKFSRSKADA